MNDIAIKVENLTKIYPLYNNPKDRMKEALHPFRKKYHHDFYALKDVSFEIKKGETVGIIGKNGAGKSTLLKILTGVLSPTSGSVHVNGRVSSLLELGTGFNTELNGYDNIFFYGTINSIPEGEMKTKVDDIIAFADIGEFIHQPVKTYSSGMFVRLAFAVATCIDPEILIIDEALSVGDMVFQSKCMLRMKKMIELGCSLIFVSHDIGSVKSICQTTIYFDKGAVKCAGISEFVVNAYLQDVRTKIEQNTNNKNHPEKKNEYLSNIRNLKYITLNSTNGYGSKQILIDEYILLNSRGEPSNEFDWGETITIIAISSFHCVAELYSIGYLIKDIFGLDIVGTNLKHEKIYTPVMNNNKILSVKFSLPLFLLPGIYTLTLAASLNTINEEVISSWHDNICTFKVNKTISTIPDTKVYIPTKIQLEVLS